MYKFVKNTTSTKSLEVLPPISSEIFEIHFMVLSTNSLEAPQNCPFITLAIVLILIMHIEDINVLLLVWYTDAYVCVVCVCVRKGHSN